MRRQRETLATEDVIQPPRGFGRAGLAEAEAKAAAARPRSSARRVSRAAARTVYATVAAGVAGAVIGALVPIGWLERLVYELYLDSIIPAARAPLGFTAKLALTLVLAMLAAAVTFAIMRFIQRKPVAEPQASTRALDRARNQVDETPLDLRAVDAHPDAPARQPIFAERDLPGGGLGPIPAPAEPDRFAADPASPAYHTPDLSRFDTPDMPPPARDVLADDAPLLLSDDFADTVDLGQYRAADPVVPSSLAPESVAPSAPAPAPIAPSVNDQSLGQLVERFEAGLSRRRAASAAGAAAAPADSEAREPMVDFALESALSTLQRMNRRAVG